MIVRRLVQFAWLELQSCLFAIAVFAGLLVTHVVPLPIAAYDAMLLWCVAVTLAFKALGLETWREVAVIVAFHALGPGLELRVTDYPARYPDQLDVWQSVHASKIGAWALLVTMSFVLVALVKAQEGRLYHRSDD